MDRDSKEERKKAAIITNNLNCERHIQYYSTVEKYFIKNGWIIVEDFNVNKVIICGCGFHDMMYEKIMEAYKQLRDIHFLEKNIIIMGCSPKTHEIELEKDFNGHVIPLHNEELLDKIIDAKVPFSEVTPNNLFRAHKDCKLSAENELFHIKISEGCLRGCTFCVINKAKGYIRSVPPDEIVKQFKTAMQYGKKKIFLMGEDTFAYGIDINTNIIDLIETLVAINPDVEYHFGSLHIKWLHKYSEGLLALCKRGITKKLHIGLQHVNDKILKKMGRPVKFTEVYDIICLLKRECPELYIGVDIIVGFPGETEAMFEELVEFFKKDRYINNIQLNGYSDIKGAPSFKLKNKNSTAEIARRWTYLNDHILGERSAFNRSDETSNEDITFRLTQKNDYSFCKHTFNDKVEEIAGSQRLHRARSTVLREDQIDFEF